MEENIEYKQYDNREEIDYKYILIIYIYIYINLLYSKIQISLVIFNLFDTNCGKIVVFISSELF